MTDATTLATKHGLTQREAEVVLMRKEAGGASLEDQVAQIKSERVGPAAFPEGTRNDLNQPGSSISPPLATTPPTAEEHLAELQRRRGELDEEIGRAEEAVAAAELQSRTTATVGPTAEEGPRVWSDDEIREANAPELVAYVTENPEEKHRVQRFELDRPNPRKSVLDAVEAS